MHYFSVTLLYTKPITCQLLQGYVQCGKSWSNMFYIIPLPFYFVLMKALKIVIPFTKKTVLLKQLLIKRRSKALMKIYVPL